MSDFRMNPDSVGAAVDRLQKAAAGMLTLAELPGLRRAVASGDSVAMDAGLAVLAASAARVLEAAKALSTVIHQHPGADS